MTFTAARRIRPWTGPTTGTGRKILLLGLAVACGLALIGCDESEVVPPLGSTVTLSANPATLVQTGTQTPESDLSARVTNSLGVSLPGQTVVFNTSEGVLDPPALTSIETDQNGIAKTKLKTIRTTTIDATSGVATSTLTISVLPGNIGSILVEGDNSLVNCSLSLRFLVTVFDTDVPANPVPGVTLSFQLRDATGSDGSVGDWAGTFSPANANTDGDGEVKSIILTPDPNDCFDKCANGKTCQATVVAVEQSGLFKSPPLIISDAVP